MHSELEKELEKTGEELRASHDDEVIEDVIAEIEALDDSSSEVTAQIVRKMVGMEGE